MDLKKFGHKVNDRRLVKLMSITELSRKSGVSSYVISRLEMGLVNKLDRKAIESIADALGFNPDTFASTTLDLWYPY